MVALVIPLIALEVLDASQASDPCRSRPTLDRVPPDGSAICSLLRDQAVWTTGARQMLQLAIDRLVFSDRGSPPARFNAADPVADAAT